MLAEISLRPTPAAGMSSLVSNVKVGTARNGLAAILSRTGREASDMLRTQSRPVTDRYIHSSLMKCGRAGNAADASRRTSPELHIYVSRQEQLPQTC